MSLLASKDKHSNCQGTTGELELWQALSMHLRSLSSAAGLQVWVSLGKLNSGGMKRVPVDLQRVDANGSLLTLKQTFYLVIRCARNCKVWVPAMLRQRQALP